MLGLLFPAARIGLTALGLNDAIGWFKGGAEKPGQLNTTKLAVAGVAAAAAVMIFRRPSAPPREPSRRRR